MRGADHLRGGTHGVRVLHLGLDLAGLQVAALDACADGPGRAHRAREATDFVQTRIVRFQVGEQRLERHRAGNLGLLEEAVHVVEVNGAHGGEQVRAVDGRQTVARLQARDRDAGAFHCHARRKALALIPGLAFAHHQQRHLRHRRKIAAGADRAFLAHHRRDAGIQQRNKRLRDLGPAAGVAVRMDVYPSRHGTAHVFDRCGIADAGGVIVDKILLKFRHLLVGEHDFGEFTDAGVDPVHDFVRRDFRVQHGAATHDALQGLGVQFDRFIVAGDGDKFFDGQAGAVDDDRHRCVPGTSG